MKKLILPILLILSLGFSNTINAQTDSLEIMLDNVVAMSEKGDTKAAEIAMMSSTSKIEKEANESKGDFKDKLLGSVGGLKAMLPMVMAGGGKVAGLQKAISMIKLLMGANRLSSMLGGGGSLLGQAAGLKSNLGLLKMGMGALSGGSSDQMGSLLSAAMGSVTQLEKGGMGAKTAEPALKKQLGSVLEMVKKGI